MSKLQEIVKDREPGMLQAMGSQKVGYNLATEQQIYIFTYIIIFVGNIPRWRIVIQMIDKLDTNC